MKLFTTILLTLFVAEAVNAAELRVAVASNFTATMEKIVDAYQARYDHRVKIISGSSGKHFAQIVNGAPFDIFYAANKEFPVLLNERKIGVNETNYVYARGKLALWSTTLTPVNQQTLTKMDYHRLAIANPRLAPYGRAAEQALRHMGLLDKVRKRIVRGENINQSLQYVATGNAQLGFVAMSQIMALSQIPAHSPIDQSAYWLVPQQYYDPIDQSAILLKEGIAQRSFYEFCKTEEIRSIIEANGYGIAAVSL